MLHSSSGSLPRVELEIVRGRAKNRRRRIEVPVFLIGSANDCDLVLADTEFPEVHTYVYVTPQGVSVRRLGEGPELTVDGCRVQNSPLRHGQRLAIGNYEFTVHVDAPHDGGKQPASEQPATFAARIPVCVDEAGIAEVRALLGDIRAALKIETGLKLYIESESPWRTVTSHSGLSVRRATA